ncbi:hypothetical protein NDU88_000882 [Pleurodeles waltl]|uniref:Uncharacterized protein n=1 Tax=Pleurodeles waltl TaxID=8319 RepID=A0AAV7MLV1_PLEWA|nr:hypothetical protein NDU88_000882 [Pleurodeles waltl]
MGCCGHVTAHLPHPPPLSSSSRRCTGDQFDSSESFKRPQTAASADVHAPSLPPSRRLEPLCAQELAGEYPPFVTISSQLLADSTPSSWRCERTIFSPSPGEQLVMCLLISRGDGGTYYLLSLTPKPLAF